MATTPHQDQPGSPTRTPSDPSPTFEFIFDGRSVQARQSDTVASALYASGVRIFSRSLKYHRPRGLLCVAGRCPNCLMTVDGVPNVRVCTAPARPGMQVTHQNAWLSLEHDALSVLDRFDRLLPVGFYYKTFHTPRLFWRLSQPIIRRVAGLGRVDGSSASAAHSPHENMHAQVAVVGGGVAGMSAALAAAGAGARTVLIDDQPSLGGDLRLDTGADYDALENLPAATGREIVAALAKAVSSSEGIEVLSPAAAFGLYEGNLLGIMRDQSVVKLRAGRIVVATGAYEVPLVFDRNDLPGVMLSTAIQRLIHLHGIKPASTAMVATTNDHGYHAALDMLRAGVRVAVLVDSRSGFPHGLDAAADLQSSGVLILTSHAIVRAEGVKKVVGCVVARIEEGKLTTEERQFDGDLIAMSGGFQPAGALLQQAGCALEYDRALDQSVPTVLPPAMYAAGEVTGTGGPRVSVLEGRIAGLEAAHSLDATPDGDGMEIAALRAELDIVNSSGRSGVLATPAPSEPGVGSKKFVCFCEDVTAKDIVRAVDEGFEDIQILKRYSTVTMGPCQGKMCHKSYVDIAAERTGLGIDALGATTSRPPIQPVSLGALAGPSHMPIKRTPLDRKHRDLGAVMIDSGPWQRPQSYYSPQDECLAVRERVGIIDVSTLGKLDVQGDDAPALLDKIYTHHFSTLRPGRIRYGLLCADDGVIMDDGTVTRIADDHYFVTTSTASIEEIEQWFKWWMAGTRMCAHVTNVTNALAAVNVAGPKARDTLVKLTDVDLSPRGFRYMRSKAGDVAGVPTRFLRIGFVGETGWELHFPSEYAEYMWDTLMDAGQEFGISPFGTEAQRILRLEKKHIIAQQDTDIVSNPLDSDMEWVVRFDKEDFIGRGGLVQARERGARNKLVGFVMREDPVPADGDPVVIGPAPIGHVTSSRLSPTRGRGIGLAWVPVGLAEDGGEIWIRVDGRVVPAVVTGEPFYDPEGKRLRQ